MANKADPDQMSQNAASDQGLHCLQTIQPFFFSNITSYSLIYLKSKMGSSNIYCGRVYSVFNRLIAPEKGWRLALLKNIREFSKVKQYADYK